MNTTTFPRTRSPLDSLACVNVRCELYGQAGQQNLTVRKVYGKDGIRYLRCRAQGAPGGSEFSERKRTALWNTKGPRGLPEAKAVAVAGTSGGRLLVERDGAPGQSRPQHGATVESTAG